MLKTTKCNWCGAEWDYDETLDICLTCNQMDYLMDIKAYCVGCHKGDSEPATHQLVPQGNKCCECAECPNLTCSKNSVE